MSDYGIRTYADLAETCRGMVLANEIASRPLEPVHISALAAEGEHIHHSSGLQQVHSPLSEGLRRGDCPHRGQFQHQVRAALQS